MGFPISPISTRSQHRRLGVRAALLVLAAGVIPAWAAVVFSSDATINYGINDHVEVTGTAAVTVVPGGSISGGLVTWDTSVAGISGGSVGGTAVALDASEIKLNGGSVGEDLLTGLAPDAGGSTARVSGGTLAGILAAYDGSTVHLSGGVIGGELRAYYGGVAHVYGSNLRLEEIGYPEFLLTGTLADGTPINLLVGLLKGALPSQILLHHPGQLEDQVDELVGDGALTDAEGHALRVKLAAAEAALARGNRKAAAGALAAFIKQVEALVKSGRLTPAQGQALIAEAEALLAGLG